MAEMTATECLRELLDEFETECFELRREATETRAKDEVVHEAYEHMLDKFAQAIAATLGRVTCHADENGNCSECGEDLVRCDVGIGAGGGAVELDPPIYYNYCPNCGREVVSE